MSDVLVSLFLNLPPYRIPVSAMNPHDSDCAHVFLKNGSDLMYFGVDLVQIDLVCVSSVSEGVSTGKRHIFI